LIFDSSALIETIRAGTGFEEGAISVITLIEVLRGIDDEKKRTKMIGLIKGAFDILVVDEAVGRAYLELYFELKNKGELASDADTLIAATAQSKRETLITADRGFLRFEPFIKIRLLDVRK